VFDYIPFQFFTHTTGTTHFQLAELLLASE